MVDCVITVCLYRHQPPVGEICFMFSNPNDNETCQVVSAAATHQGVKGCVFSWAYVSEVCRLFSAGPRHS